MSNIYGDIISKWLRSEATQFNTRSVGFESCELLYNIKDVKHQIHQHHQTMYYMQLTTTLMIETNILESLIRGIIAGHNSIVDLSPQMGRLYFVHASNYCLRTVL